MKKLLIVLCFFAIKASAQKLVKPYYSTKVDTVQVKQDSIVIVTMDLNAYRELLYTITANIDSKNVTNAVTQFFKEHAQLKLVDADKSKYKPKN